MYGIGGRAVMEVAMDTLLLLYRSLLSFDNDWGWWYASAMPMWSLVMSIAIIALRRYVQWHLFYRESAKCKRRGRGKKEFQRQVQACIKTIGRITSTSVCLSDHSIPSLAQASAALACTLPTSCNLVCEKGRFIPRLLTEWFQISLQRTSNDEKKVSE